MSNQFEVTQVMSMIGCDEDTARTYLNAANGDVLTAVFEHVNFTTVTGDKHIPVAPVIDDGLTPEVREKLAETRRLTNLLTASPRNDLRQTPSVQRSEEPQSGQQLEQQQLELPMVQDAAVLA